VFPIAYGEDADLGTLTRIAQASRAAVYDASDPTTISKVFVSVISNF
jgi:Ca-activated chloride channel homolog